MRSSGSRQKQKNASLSWHDLQLQRHEEEPVGLLPDEDFNIENLDQIQGTSDSAIKDYNAVFIRITNIFGKFQNYYKDFHFA
jgi:type I restriction enzyme R subunit